MPRTGRPRQFDRDAALDAAMQLFWRQGFESTSLDQLKRAMGGLSAASFYGAFGSKETLYRETLDRYLGTHGQVVGALHDETLAPRDALERALRLSARMQTNAGLPKGCMLVLSTLNASPENHPLQALVAAERQRSRDAIRRGIDRAVASGELRPDADAEGLATLAEALLVGMSVQARDGVTQAAIEAAVSSLLHLWDTNRARPRKPSTAPGTGGAGTPVH
jgi:AcrR family transcriptional regulator